MTPEQIRDLVRSRYGAIAASSCCASTAAPASCCGPAPDADAMAKRMGYDESDLDAAGDGANLGLGCGNPQAIAAMRPGDVVVDLGSGAGFDAFLAVRQVGESGRVIGVDMTHEMLAKARANAAKLGLTNVQFRLGEIEHRSRCRCRPGWGNPKSPCTVRRTGLAGPSASGCRWCTCWRVGSPRALRPARPG
ncbi:MAG: methyltransferase domain-containing protein [Alphaproteobacteria bacterium]|nr:methyltransferase domain-containing protein [Alphaproteobacteria bacterium]